MSTTWDYRGAEATMPAVLPDLPGLAVVVLADRHPLVGEQIDGESRLVALSVPGRQGRPFEEPSRVYHP